MQTGTMERLIWVLIFGGMLVVCLGLALVQGGTASGWVVAGVGGAAVALGGLLIFVRSRRS